MTDTPTRFTAALADRYRIESELGVGGMAIIYLRGAVGRPASYLRVAPHWVDRMKKAVDEANQ